MVWKRKRTTKKPNNHGWVVRKEGAKGETKQSGRSFETISTEEIANGVRDKFHKEKNIERKLE